MASFVTMFFLCSCPAWAAIVRTGVGEDVGQEHAHISIEATPGTGSPACQEKPNGCKCGSHNAGQDSYGREIADFWPTEKPAEEAIRKSRGLTRQLAPYNGLGADRCAQFTDEVTCTSSYTKTVRGYAFCFWNDIPAISTKNQGTIKPKRYGCSKKKAYVQLPCDSRPLLQLEEVRKEAEERGSIHIPGGSFSTCLTDSRIRSNQLAKLPAGRNSIITAIEGCALQRGNIEQFDKSGQHAGSIEEYVACDNMKDSKVTYISEVKTCVVEEPLAPLTGDCSCAAHID